MSNGRRLARVLTVREVAELPGLGLELAAGAAGVDGPIRWLHVSELGDPTPWLEGGELLLTTGLGLGDGDAAQRAYVRRLVDHGLAGLALGLGVAHDEVPAAAAAEADAAGFPILTVPYETPFIAITKSAFAVLASEELDRLTQALEVHELLAQAVLDGRGVAALLAILSGRLGASLALVDEGGRTLGERHAGERLAFDGALALPVSAPGSAATLLVARAGPAFGEYDRLVLHHGRTALALELSRRTAVSDAELRLAGDLLDDLEADRLDGSDVERRISAFGLHPEGRYAALLAVPGGGAPGERLRLAVARELERRGVRHLSATRRDRAAFLLEVDGEEAAVELAHELAAAVPDARIGVGRPSSGRLLGRSLVEARAALEAAAGPVASYRDLGSLELLLGLPDAALEAFVDRVLGPVAGSGPLLESLRTLLEAGCRWSDAAARLGVHRHTLRYRMERLEEQTGLHPDRPAERMELWLAVKASQALAARSGRRRERVRA